MSTRHEVILKGLFDPPATHRGAPTILQSTRQEFVEHLLSSLGNDAGRSELKEERAKESSNHVLALFQPVHRVFHPVVVQAWCTTHQRRLNPKRIVSGGLVVRRVTETGQEMWVKEKGKVLGWKRVPDEWEKGWDPSAATRAEQRKRKTPYYRLASPALADAWEEDCVPLFPVPPEVCGEAKATLLFGVPTLASMEISEVLAEPPFTESDIAPRVPKLLTAGSTGLFTSGEIAAEATVYRSWGETQDETDKPSTALFKLLWYLSVEVGAFSPHEPAAELKKLLAAMTVDVSESDPRTGQSLTDFWSYLKYARDVLLGETEAERDGLPDMVRLPKAWPAIDTLTETEIVSAIASSMKRRWDSLTPGEGRFQRIDNRYVITAFLRVCPCDCGDPITVWSDPTEEFVIKPWHAASPVPPVVVPLPELDTEKMKEMKPAVAFQVPPSVQNFMDGLKLKDVMAGKRPKKGEATVLKLCCFSIPIVTLCAFILLQIMLTILNYIFGWLPFVRVCFPLLSSGKPETEESS